VHIGATWQTGLNHPFEAVMQLFCETTLTTCCIILCLYEVNVGNVSFVVRFILRSSVSFSPMMMRMAEIELVVRDYCAYT